MISGQWGDEHSQIFVTENHKENVLKNPENELYFTLQKFYNCVKEAPRIINTIYIEKWVLYLQNASALRGDHHHHLRTILVNYFNPVNPHHLYQKLQMMKTDKDVRGNQQIQK